MKIIEVKIVKGCLSGEELDLIFLFSLGDLMHRVEQTVIPHISAQLLLHKQQVENELRYFPKVSVIKSWLQ